MNKPFDLVQRELKYCLCTNTVVKIEVSVLYCFAVVELYGFPKLNSTSLSTSSV
jgi:hypothetical protein